MTHFATIFYSVLLGVLVLLAGFFSCSETGLMTVNRYRIRHQAKMKKERAILILNLLQRPDRLLSVLLIGGTVTTIFASSVATFLGLHFGGEMGALLATIALTVVMLIFVDIAPKTFAALYADRVADIVVWPVTILKKILSPFITLVNGFSNGLLRLFGVRVSTYAAEPLTREELRSVVYEGAGKLPSQYQNMLLSILDLNTLTVNDVMIPKHQIHGVDINANEALIQEILTKSQYNWLPVYRDNINHLLGVLHIRELMQAGVQGRLNRDHLMTLLYEPYFIPEGTPLHIQLIHFQQQRKRLAFVVDEYGDMSGLLTLEDILEEIIGEFTTSLMGGSQLIRAQSDGSFLVSGSVLIRDLNRAAGMNFPTRGSKTLNGVIIDYLEAIPRAGTSLKISDHPLEILEMEDNRIKTVRVFPKNLF